MMFSKCARAKWMSECSAFLFHDPIFSLIQKLVFTFIKSYRLKNKKKRRRNGPISLPVSVGIKLSLWVGPAIVCGYLSMFNLSIIVKLISILILQEINIIIKVIYEAMCHTLWFLHSLASASTFSHPLYCHILTDECSSWTSPVNGRDRLAVHLPVSSLSWIHRYALFPKSPCHFCQVSSSQQNVRTVRWGINFWGWPTKTPHVLFTPFPFY